MSDWEKDKHIAAEFSETTGELMFSASDVIAYLRHCAATMEPRHLYTPGVNAIADQIASNWLKATREHFMEEGE